MSYFGHSTPSPLGVPYLTPPYSYFNLLSAVYYWSTERLSGGCFMSVFISYSSRDAGFVDRLALELIKNNIKVWKDKWKMKAGDPILETIVGGIEGASYLCLVISEDALKSKWVTREVEAAIAKQQSSKNITIVPVLIDDCKVPALLEGLKYADFRNYFDYGAQQIISLVSSKYNLSDAGASLSKSDENDYFFYYSLDDRTADGRYSMDVDIVSFDTDEKFSVLTQITFLGNEHCNRTELGLDEGESMKYFLLRTCAAEFNHSPARVKLEGNNAVTGKFTLYDANSEPFLNVSIKVRRLGIPSGSLIFNVGALFGQLCVSCGIGV